jgi:transcriptional regulator with XRE-family HTH domain
MHSNMIDRHIPVNHVYSCSGMEPQPIIRHNGRMKKLREMRERRGLSQVELAEIVGVGQGYISKIEHGSVNVTLEKILLIAQALKVDPVELFEIPELQQRALAALSAIDPDRREAALVVLEAMAEKTR